MTTVLEIGCRVPEQAVPIAEIGARVGLDERALWTFRRFFGLREVRRAPGEDLRTMLGAALATLRGLPGNEHRVRYVLRASTMSTVDKMANTAVRDVCADFGLDAAVAFTVTQHACATGLFALRLAGELLADDGDPDALAVVLTGEKVFAETIEVIPESTVMGESTAACLVTAGVHPRRGDVLLGYASRTLGEYADAFPPDAVDPGFFAGHNDVLAEVMAKAAAEAGVALGDLALILPHNVNRLSWSRTCRGLGIPLERVFLDNVAVTGHCFTADPFVNHVHAVAGGRLHPGELYLMASVGLGATFSAAVLRRSTPQE